MEKNIKYEITAFHNDIASSYDYMVDASIPAKTIREHFQCRILKSIKPGEHILEIGCGTGTDAILLAKNGIKVTATDISENMIEAAQSKVHNNGLSDLIETAVLDADNLVSLNGGKYDGLISNFNAVNYVKDIESFSINSSSILKPNAKVFFVMLNKVCLWEVFYNLVKLKPVTAFKRLASREKDYKTKMHLYFPRKVKKIFSKYFRIKNITGFGFLFPPDGLSTFHKKHEKFFGKIQSIENFLCSEYPFYNFCDHYLIEMERK
jgi:ubiquinone/menaquinone biosynthesis C-methylase UbiE